MRELEQSVDALGRATFEISRGLNLQTEAERMGGFGITTRDLETGEYWISEGVYKIFGLRRLSALSTRSVVELWAETVHPDDVEAVRADGTTAIEDGSEHDIVHRIIRPDGEERLVHSKGKRIEATNGHPAIFLATVVDVTQPS